MHQAVLEARDIRKAYRRHPVLRGANLAVGPGAPPAAPSHSRDGPAAAAPALEAAPDRDTWHAAGLAPGLWTETPPPVLFSECRTGPGGEPARGQHPECRGGERPGGQGGIGRTSPAPYLTAARNRHV